MAFVLRSNFLNKFTQFKAVIHASRTYVNTYVDDLFDGLTKSKRSDLAKSITLVETSNAEKKIKSQLLLHKVLDDLKHKRLDNKPPSLRIGITGPPGAGKSSLIETFGKYLTEYGIRVAVLTVDPSSTTTGGSILGDKVRMSELSRDSNAYIRSSPNKGNLGGVTRTTLETIFLCEAANFNVVLVETVGVGQAEHAVVDMVDCMVLLIPPGSGDELQGMKKGIAELADIVAITKYDEDLKQEAMRLKREYTSASKYIRKKSKHWSPKVILTSAATKFGIDDLWNLLREYQKTMMENKEFYEKRESQLKLWFWTHLKENFLDMLLSKPYIKAKLESLEREVIEGNITPGQASDIIIKDFSNVLKSDNSNN